MPASRALLAVDEDALLLTLRFWELSQSARSVPPPSWTTTEPLGITGAEPCTGWLAVRCGAGGGAGLGADLTGSTPSPGSLVLLHG